MVAAGISAGVRPGPPRFTVVSSRAVLAGGSVAQGPDPGPAQPASVGWVAGQVRTSVCPIAAPRHLLTPPTSRRRRTPPRLFVSGRRRLAAASLDCASGPGCRLLTGERVFVPVCTMLLSRSIPARGGDTVRGPPPRRELHCMGGALAHSAVTILRHGVPVGRQWRSVRVDASRTARAFSATWICSLHCTCALLLTAFHGAPPQSEQRRLVCGMPAGRIAWLGLIGEGSRGDSCLQLQNCH